MKCALSLWLTFAAANGQTGTGSIQGTVVDAKTQKAIPGALVIANSAGVPPLIRNTKSGADGAFQIQGLAAGKYFLCVQALGDQYLDSCRWNDSPAIIALISGQAAAGVSLKLTPASVLIIQVQDAQRALSQQTKDGRRPDLTLGVWGPRGLYYPARVSGSQTAGPDPLGGVRYRYQLAVPRDTDLNFYIASHDLQLGDAAGAALLGNASQQVFRHTTNEPNPKSFSFSVLSLVR